jgi:aspartate carbamoyltransferase catalytic subunit
MKMTRAHKMTRASKKPLTRHIASINDLTNREIGSVFDMAEGYLAELSDKAFPYRIRRSITEASRCILATLFYEPSTRTRLSFESAMLRLGGQTITSADPNTSSAAKGESLADSVRVISNYADVLVIRHPKDGAARLAADYATIPVINGGDGSHEHPTQTLCDLFTLRKKHRGLKNLNVAIAGDLRGSRTIHSFVYALARFGAHIVPMPAPGMELPAHVDRRLRDEFHCDFEPSGAIGALYRTPVEPHQPALFSGQDFEISVKGYNAIDKKIRRSDSEHLAAVYVTRFQKERWNEKEQDYPKIDAEFLKAEKYSHASVLHPLPRVGELDASVDADTRAVYFEQAAYGVPVRMALISLLLGLRKGSAFPKFAGGFEPQKMPIYDHSRTDGIQCENRNCIVHEASEAQYVRNKFHFIKTSSPPNYKLRCAYCETDIDRFVVASRKHRWFSHDAAIVSHSLENNVKDTVVFANERQAHEAGYHPRKQSTAAEPANHKKAKARYG